MIAAEPVFLHAAVFLVAALYSSVGHGGASGYLAILSILSCPKELAIPSALILNVLVSGTAFAAFARAGRFHWGLTWPFIAASIPAAYLGGALKISSAAYSSLLAAALIVAAVRMWLDLRRSEPQDLPPRPAPRPWALALGGGIGFVSGIIGIGGGVFLSPVLLLSGWADPKQAAAASACFILVNSLAGLAGAWGHGGLASGALGAPPVLAALAGGFLGARLGAGRLSFSALRRVLSLILLTAGMKLLWSARSGAL